MSYKELEKTRFCYGCSKYYRVEDGHRCLNIKPRKGVLERLKLWFFREIVSPIIMIYVAFRLERILKDGGKMEK